MKIIDFLKKNSYLFKRFIKIVNLYTNRGDYDKSFDFDLFKKRVLPKIIESSVFGILFICSVLIFNSDINAEKIISFSISFYASILGFGMAAYTILLMLADEILFFLNDTSDKNNMTPQILNSDLAFPLIMIGVIVFFMFFLLSFGNSFLTLFLTSSLFIYGLLLVLEIISVIYLSMGLVIKKKIEKRNEGSK
ncbi:hypothetical protein [Halarcobacter sp.]|uniref:hypothetical protein n=1 Tax=Halarcobacter sp. TaxID=2321133 RepID=UPI003A937D2D